MGFLGIYTALYDYQPLGENELEIQEGELLFVLEKGEDDWWKAKKKAADDEDDEPVGLVPINYLEEVGIQNSLHLTHPKHGHIPLVHCLSVYHLADCGLNPGQTCLFRESTLRLLQADRRRSFLYGRCGIVGL